MTDCVISYQFTDLKRDEQTVAVYEIPLNFVGRDCGDVQAEVVLEGKDCDLSNNRVVLHIGAPAETTEHVHTLEKVEAVAATCTQSGCGEYWSCTLCGAFFADGNGETELDADPSTAPLGHVAEEEPTQLNYVPPTIYADGGYDTVVFCSRCHAVISSVHTSIPAIVPINPFSDVSGTDYFYDAVIWAVYHEPKVTAGTEANIFSPHAVCTRAQIVTFLWRAMGSPEPAISLEETGFTDVAAGSWYEPAVRWAMENGITNGTKYDRFSPNKKCSRCQAITFIWRAAGSPELQEEDMPFTDVPLDAYYSMAVRWAVKNGITNGTSETSFSPHEPCTRAQVLTFLWQADRVGLNPISEADYRVIREFDFETDPASEGWTFLDADEDGHGWEWTYGNSSCEPMSGEGVLSSASWSNYPLSPDNWAISPAIDLSGLTSRELILSLYAKARSANWADEHFAVYAGCSPDPNLMTQILPETISRGDWTQYTASLADFAGQSEVYVAIRHFNVTDMFWLDVDLLKILAR